MSENSINSSKAPEPVGLYPHAKRVGNLLFLSGVGPREKGTKIIPGVELDANGKSFQGKYGKYIRHPFSGVSLAEQCGVPAAVCHIIATHAGEGDMVKRTVEAYVVHHADFMTFEPFRDRLK